MTTEIIVTGTGMPLVDPNRAGPGVLIRHGDVKLQFDVGRDTVRRLAAAGTVVSELSAVFLTHYHSDHVIGLQDLALSYWVQDFERRNRGLDIISPNGATSRFCERMLDVWDDDLAVRAAHANRPGEPRINLIGFDGPEHPTEVWARDGVRVIAGQVRHEPVVGAIGYRIETSDGVIVITGDTIVCDEVAELAEGADVVIYEAFRFAEWRATMPPSMQYITEYHADTELIGAQMAELEVPTLMLTHLIPPPNTDAEKQGFIDDVRKAGYRGELIVCDDLETVTLPRAGRNP